MIIGLDLSLRAAACCMIPHRWDQSVDTTQTRVIGMSLAQDSDDGERSDRVSFISNGILGFIREFDLRMLSAVFIEDYAFGAVGAHTRSIAELTGVVKWRIADELGMKPKTVPASQARKYLLQRLPGTRGTPKGFMKKYVAFNVRRIGGQVDAWGEDEIDAFVVANYGQMVMGGVAISFEGRLPSGHEQPSSPSRRVGAGRGTMGTSRSR